MTLHRISVLLAATAMTISSSLAQKTDMLDEWFDALRNTNRTQLSELLDEDARIVLNDIGIEQTKQEFLASLDAWEDAAGDGTEIRYRVEDEIDTTKVVSVCYDFPANSVFTSERFVIENGKIVRSEQSQIAENCDDF